MIEKTDIELKIVDSVDTSDIEGVLDDSAFNPDAFYVGRGYLAHNGEKVIEGIDTDGTYPNVTVGNATKATTADTANRANTAATAATAVNISEAPVLAATEDEQITVKVGNKTSNALTVPYAQRADFATDLTGRVEATPEVFTYRPSAGDKSIKDDNAFIRRVKGNSVVWNQIGNPLSADGGWYLNPEYGTVEYGYNYIKITAVSDSQPINGMGLTCVQPLAQAQNGHLYMMTVEMKPSKTMTCGFRGFADTWTGNNYSLTGNTWTNISYLVTCTSETTRYPFVGNSLGSQIVSGDTIEMKNLIIIDLTQMFGAGNEPTTIEEFRALYPDSYYPYNAGELRNLNCYGIKTVGFNQWDGTTQVGYINDKTGVVTSNSSYLCTDFIRVIPNQEYYINTEQTNGRWGAWYDANKNYVAGILNYDQVYVAPPTAAYVRLTIKTADSGNPETFCINLHHTGYRDGEYEPYKEVTHTLPLSQITNGEPLRKAGGDVYDEVNNEYYIRRVGVRSYTTGDKDDATLLTDGTYTNYPLDEPIYTPIETPIDFNYYVEDFGTEEALLTEGSAPFSADIVYQFNATDQVRNNSRAIKWLKKSAFIPSGTTAQYVRGDGSYGDTAELSRVIPINDGEHETPDGGDYDRQFALTPNYYAKSPVELDNTATVAVYVTPPDTNNILAEYWFEFVIGDTMPDITFISAYENAVFRFSGEMITEATNILHITSSDGGVTFFGEIKNYII